MVAASVLLTDQPGSGCGVALSAVMFAALNEAAATSPCTTPYRASKENPAKSAPTENSFELCGT